ncbi:MAG: OmpA family protein [Bacteroidia bacterium]|nr:OmpA family protein [Bacteroidia bacterium]
MPNFHKRDFKFILPLKQNKNMKGNLLCILLAIDFNAYSQIATKKCNVTVQITDKESGKSIPKCILYYKASPDSPFIKVPLDSFGATTINIDTGLAIELYSTCNCYYDSPYETFKAPVKDTIIHIKQSNLVYDEPNSLIVLAFRKNSTTITRYGSFYLDELCKMMMKYPKMCIEIRGYAYFKNDSVKSQHLSEKRAEIIYQELVKRGITDNRLRHVGLGSLKELNTQNYRETRKLNARIILVILPRKKC